MCACRERRWPSSRPTRSGWAGRPNGCRQPIAISTSTITCPSRRRSSPRKVHYNYGTVEGFDELPGLSVFCKDKDGTVYHTYSSYARGNEEAIGAFVYLDITPKGRNEKEIMDWVKRNDEYGAPAATKSCCH